jgi:hypothetical protein
MLIHFVLLGDLLRAWRDVLPRGLCRPLTLSPGNDCAYVAAKQLPPNGAEAICQATACSKLAEGSCNATRGGSAGILGPHQMTAQLETCAQGCAALLDCTVAGAAQATSPGLVSLVGTSMFSGGKLPSLGLGLCTAMSRFRL